MVFDLQRVIDGLAVQGFYLAYDAQDMWTTVFFRTLGPDLFGRIRIKQVWQRFARRGEFVGVTVECAIAPGKTVIDGMFESAIVDELGGPTISDAVHLQSGHDARQWEDALLHLAPERAENLVRKSGHGLLESTMEAREAVKRYGELLGGFIHEPDRFVVMLNKRASGRQRSEVSRIVKSGITWLHGIYYELAALTIAVCAGDVVGDPEWFFGLDPNAPNGQRLMIELQLLASRFAREPGWE